MVTEVSRDTLKELELKDVKDLSNELGRGAYGFVKDVLVHGTVCAAKVVHEILLMHANEEEYKKLQKMFIHECFQCSNLRHPNLTQFLGIYYPNDSTSFPWLIMEKLHASLTNLLKKYPREDFSFARKISILQDVSLGIQYLHSKNIVHRDISSNNVLVTKDLVAKLSDFGVAKMIDPEQAKSHTQTPGTLIFMPPESTSVSPRYHKPVDIFSFGCVTIHIMTHQWPIPDDQVTPDRQVLSEIERRMKYLNIVKIIMPLKMLIASCLENVPDQRPTIDKVVQKLQSIVTKESLPVYDNIIELEKQLKSQKIVESVPTDRDVMSMGCHRSKHVKLSLNHVMEKSIKLSESFSKVLENLKLPGSMFTEGSHFVFSHGGKIFVLCDVKNYYKFSGRYVVLFDLQNDRLEFIDKEIRRLSLHGKSFVALERDPKMPGKAFYDLDLSCYTWVASNAIQPIPTAEMKYPDMLAYSSLLFVISGNLMQVFTFDMKKWFQFKLVIKQGTIEPSLKTTYAIIHDRLYICYADNSELYYLDMQDINDAIITQSQPAKLMTLHLKSMLSPVNYIIAHEDYLIALFVNTEDYEKHIRWAWYYSASCDHWHIITSFDPYIDGQWFTMENGKAAVTQLYSYWSLWYGWDITITTHQVQLTEEV